MSSTALPKWWEALASDRCNGCARAEWQSALGDEMPLIERFLVARGTVPILTHLSAHGPRRYRVVAHGRDDVIGVPDDDDVEERVRLSRSAILRWVVDWDALHVALIAGLGLEAGIYTHADQPLVWCLGRVLVGDEQTASVHLALGDLRAPSRSVAAQQLLIRSSGPILLLVATASATPEPLAAAARLPSCAIVPMTRIGIDMEGRLVALRGIDSIVGDLRRALGCVSPSRPLYCLSLDGADTRIVWAGEERTLTGQSKGVRYLHELIRRAGTPILVEQLVGGIAGVDPAALRGSVGPKTDREGRRALLSRSEALDADMRAAALAGDDVTFDRLQAEQETIQERLRADDGYAGRNSTGSDLDRHRVSVKQAIDRAVIQIGQRLPAMAQHLRQYVLTGLAPCYRPPASEAIAWET